MTRYEDLKFGFNLLITYSVLLLVNKMYSKTFNFTVSYKLTL